MNKKIRELAKQSGISFKPFIANDEEYNFDDVFVDNPDVIEKFAELIVRECCDWIDNSPSTESGKLVHTKSFIIANLKNLIGVE